jgi:hypothetical protein
VLLAGRQRETEDYDCGIINMVVVETEFEDERCGSNSSTTLTAE